MNFWVRSAIISLIVGVLLFSGGLFMLVVLGKTHLSWITPVGGSLLILGWLNLCISGFGKLFKKD